MSQDLEAEEGLKRRLLHGEGRPSDGTNSSVVSVNGRSGTQAVNTSFFQLQKMINFAANYRIDLSCYVISILWDPLFFYTLVINDEKQCIEMDFILAWYVLGFRFFFDLAKLIHSSLVICVEYLESGKISVRLMFAWLIDLISSIIFTPMLALLIGIVSILIFTESTILRALGIRDILYARDFFLLQYLLKVIRTYHLLTEVTGVSGMLGESTWAIVAFNVLLYMHGSYVFGTLWYFFAIEKAATCWVNTCMKNTGCWGILNIAASCEARSGDYTFLNDACSVKTGNTTNNIYGLYGDAFQLGIVELTDVPKKILHCLLWGLQNLSAFGQNLQPSNDLWEIIFAICMTNYGIVLFVFLIGKMQSDTERSQKIKQMWEEIKQWQHFKDISNTVQWQIRKDKRNKWEETKGVDIDNLVNNLPEDTGKKIKRDLGRKLLKNVKEFENWSETSLEELCDCLKPVFFIERTRIIREGDPIDEMLFVLNGKLWTYSYSFMNAPTTTTMLIHRRSRENLLEDGDFCGQELIAWSQNESSSPHLPISTRTIQALTNVEAFSLMADDLKRVSSLRHFDRAAVLLQARWRFKRLLRAKRNPEKRSRLTSLMYKFI